VTELSEVKQVTLHYVGSAAAKYLVLADELDRFVEASKQLHFDPGRNPHNNVEAAKIWRITVADLEFRGPFWWTVPDLQNNDDPRGARIIDGGTERNAFIDLETVNRWHAEEAEQEAEHYRAQQRRTT
jgi:hypothetical protein